MGTVTTLRRDDCTGRVVKGYRASLLSGRHEIVPATLDPSLTFIGSDPYNSPVNTGVLVPSTPTAALVPAGGVPSQFRYLFLLAREQFNSGEQGVRLTGIRQYAELNATINGTVFRKEITHPLWRPPDGSISWHVMIIPKTKQVTRNVQNADTLMFRDSYGPALLYETIVGPQFAPTAYMPPNGGRPWGKPLGSVSLGNMHDLRYRWRSGYLEEMLDIPVPLPCDIALFASVRQNDPTTNPSDGPESATIVGNVDLTTLTYGVGGSLAGKSLDISVNGAPFVVNFVAPASVAAALAQINAVISAAATATINAENLLVIATTATGVTATLQVIGGTAVAMLGLSVMSAPVTGTSALTSDQFTALEREDRFLTAFHATAQYGRIAGSLVFDENLGEDVP